MSETAPKILEGVFAISKPPSLSSAQVLRELQSTFAASRTFAPLLEDTRHKQAEQERHQGKRRKRGRGDDAPFKMGHGGTLDPLATGVLIVGIGRGTKYLQNFLGCTKTYDTVVLFGKTTDTYDIAGKVVGEADYKHVTRDLVESKLGQFRGKIRQVPPVYSALKINGMKAYEYAREGKELPRELESREMQVDECTLLEWFEGGEHDFRWPAEEAPEEERKAVSKLMGVSEPTGTIFKDETAPQDSKPEDSQLPPYTEPQFTPETTAAAAAATSAPTSTKEPSTTEPQPSDPNTLAPADKATLHTHDHTLQLSPTPSPAPAARVRLTVSSGFYVRSFAHDLGHACSSAAIMASLLRSRQANFTTTDTDTTSLTNSPPSTDTNPLIPTLTYADLTAGEETWSPKITAQLTHWQAQNPAAQSGHIDGRDPDVRRRIADEKGARPRQRFRGDWTGETKGERKRQQGGSWKGKWNEGGNRGRMADRDRHRDGGGDGDKGVDGGHKGDGGDGEKRVRQRNSSSPE